MEQITIIKRPYKNQREKDLELCKAYELGKREAYEKAKRELLKRFILIAKWRKVCFCMGEPRWRRFCGECQDWAKRTFLTDSNNGGKSK